MYRITLMIVALTLCALPRALFALAASDMSPTPGTTLTTPPTSITVTLDQPPATGSVNAYSVRLVRAGADGVLGTADDLTILPAGISTSGTTITLDLTGVKLPNDQYQVTLVSGQSTTSGLVAHWKFDEGSGTTVLDSSGNGNSGALNSGATFTSTNLVLPGSAVKFDGVTGAIKVPQSASLEPALAVTVSMWGYITDTMGGGVGELLRKQTKDFGGYILRWNVDDGHIGWFICANNGSYWYSRDPQPNSNYLNAWHHYAATYDTATHLLDLYIDGTLRNSVSGGPAGGLDHTDDLYLMFRNNNTTNATPGTLDDVRVFNRALTAAEIQTLARVPITDSSGNPLDGKFTGTFPSGDGALTDFAATFTIAAPPLQVTALTPALNAVLAAPPASLVATLSKNVDPASVDGSSVRLIRAGPDGVLGTADDFSVPVTSVNASGGQITVDLTSTHVPNDLYQFKLLARRAGGLTFTDSQLVAIPDRPIYQVTDFTVEAWFRADAVPTSDEQIFFRADDRSGLDPFSLKLVSGGNVAFRIDTQSNSNFTVTSPAVVAQGSWVHAAGTFDSASKTLSLYVNGTLVGSAVADDLPVTTLSGANPGLAIGNIQSLLIRGPQGFQGEIRDVRLWNVARSQTEIAAAMSQTLTGAEAGLLGLWPVDEGSGQVVHDRTSNANAGTLGADASAGSDDPAWDPLTSAAVTDAAGNPLDGKFTGTFPSGDGTFADFTSTFTVAAPLLHVTALTVAPNAVLNAPPSSIVATFNKNVDPATANGNSVLLIGAGPDKTFGTADDVTISPSSLVASGNLVTINLNGQTAPGKYRLKFKSTPVSVTDLDGNLIDGEFVGTFPSGNGTAGGDFVSDFRINGLPVASAQALSLHSSTSLPIVLVATDGDNDPVSYSIVTAPSHGTLTGTPPNVTYSTSGYAGPDSFTFKANDGLADGNVATITINVTNNTPVAQAQTASVHSRVALPLALAATDADGDALTYSIVTPPAHGTLSGVLPNVTYTSGAYAGPDSFTFKANDGVADSTPATVSISLVDQPPTASLTATPTILIEGQSVDFISGASDPDGDALPYAWDFGDGGSSTDANPAHVYAAAGVYTATLTVTDTAGLTAMQSITINVYHDSDRPIARFVSSDLNGYVGQPIGFDATFSTDPANRIVSYLWDFGDGSPSGVGQLISRDYTATGTYTVTLTITNAQGLTDTTSLTMVVLPAAQAGLFSANIKYSVSWNRTAQNSDTLSLTATVNAGTTVVTRSSLLSLDVVGQTFSGTSSTKLSLSRAARGGVQVKWQIKANTKKGAPKGTYDLKCAITHATLGNAFARAGATGVKNSTTKIPIRLGIGASSFESSITSLFRFGGNGAKASGGGQGPK